MSGGGCTRYGYDGEERRNREKGNQDSEDETLERGDCERAR